MKKFYRGALISPFVAPLIFYIGTFVLQLVNGRLGSDLTEWFITGPIMIFGWGLIIGYPAMLLLGIPYVYFLLYKDKLLINYVCGGSVILGAFVSVLFTWVIGSEIRLSIIIIFSLLSLITAYTFCRIECITKPSN